MNTQVKAPKKRGVKPTIKWADYSRSWNSNTDKELAMKIKERYGDKVSDKLSSIVVNVYLRRQKLIRDGVDAAFKGRNVRKNGEKVFVTSFVRAGTAAVKK